MEVPMRTKNRGHLPCGGWPLGGALLLVVLGCGSADDGRIEVLGSVTIDGQSVDGGEIVFVPWDLDVAPDATRITGGRYRLRVFPGKNEVVVRWEREHPTQTMPGIDPGTRAPRLVQVIPPRYNDQTELTADITGPTSSLDFSLEGAVPLE